MVKYSSSVLAAANLLALAQALPAQPVCSIVVQVVTGHGVWIPQADPTWGSWADPSSKGLSPSSTASWSSWEDPSKSGKPSTKTTTTVEWSTWDPSDPSKNTKTTTTSSTSTWEAWTTATSASTSSKTTTTSTSNTTKNGGGFYTSPTSTSETTTYSTTSTATPSTTEAPFTTTTTEASSTSTSSSSSVAPVATSCPYYNGQSYEKLDNVQGGGSCDSTFTVNCGARASVPQDGSVKFWERSNGEVINSLAECLAICDSNTECTAAIWTDYAGAGAQDKLHCWQTNGLPQPSTFGGDLTTYGQLSYKGSSNGQCSASYSTTPQ